MILFSVDGIIVENCQAGLMLQAMTWLNKLYGLISFIQVMRCWRGYLSGARCE